MSALLVFLFLYTYLAYLHIHIVTYSSSASIACIFCASSGELCVVALLFDRLSLRIRPIDCLGASTFDYYECILDLRLYVLLRLIVRWLISYYKIIT